MRKRREEGMDDKAMADGGRDADAGSARDRENMWDGTAQRGSETHVERTGRVRACGEEAAFRGKQNAGVEGVYS